MAKGSRPGAIYQVRNTRGDIVNATDKAPKGWKPTEGALTAPKGYTWYSNGKSRFSGERQQILVKDSR